MNTKLLTAGLLATFVIGCEPDIQTTAPANAPTPPPIAAPAAPAAPVAQAADGEAEATPAALALRDDDFVESPLHRDPFRSFAKVFKARPPETPQREVIMSTTAVDDMRVVAVISGVPDPRAQIIDARGVGYTVRRGDFIGRPEVVQTGGEEGMGVTLNWRIDRIRPGEVVLTRADPMAPDRPAITRTLSLHPTEDQTQHR